MLGCSVVLPDGLALWDANCQQSRQPGCVGVTVDMPQLRTLAGIQRSRDLH